MDLFTYLMAKKGHNTHRDLFSYLLGKGTGGSGTYTTFSGVSLNISNTLQAKIKNIALEGNTSQETTTGKNLSKISDGTLTYEGLSITIDKGVITLNGTTASSPNIKLSNNLIGGAISEWGSEEVVSSVLNKTFSINVISGTAPTTGFAVRTYVNGAQDINANQLQNNRSFSQTYASDGVMEYIYIYSQSNKTYDNFKFTIQFENGSEVTSFEPYTYGASPNPDYPQPIKVVTGEQNIDIKNKNLLKLLNINSTFSNVKVTTNPDNSITLNGTASSNYAINIITNWSLVLENGKTYTLSGCPDLGGSNMLSLELYSNSPTNQYVTDVGKGKSFTLTTDRTYRCYVAIKAGQTYDNVTLYPMVEEGSQATEYVPYQSQTYPLSLGNIELAKIGDYKDYIFKNVVGSPYYNADLDLNGWYKYKNINKIILNGTESWIYDSKPSTPTPRTVIKTNIERHDKGIYFSNYFIYNSQTSNRIIINDNSIALYISLDNIIANIEETDSNSIRVQKMKSWLASNNTTVYYSLVTPTYEKITDTTLISQLENINNNARSYKGTTIIECTSENTDNETIVFSGDIKVTSVSNSLNTSLLSSNLQEETNIDDIQEEPNLDDVNEIEETEEEVS